MRELLIVKVLVIAFTFSLKGQSINVGGVFPTIDHSGNLSNKLEYSLYYFAAFPIFKFDGINISKKSYFHLFYSEQALNYNLSKKISLTGSYVYQRENVIDDNFVNENRFYVQTKYNHKVQKVNFTHRIRFDGRFIQNRITNKTPFTHRVRYLVGIDMPINENIYFTAYEEAFFNSFKKAEVVFGENWTYTAIGKKLNDKNKIELGLLFITWHIGKTNWFNQYYFQLSWINHLDFRKNKQ